MDWNSDGPKYTMIEIWFCGFKFIRKRSKSIWCKSKSTGIWFKILPSDFQLLKRNENLVIEDWRDNETH